MRCLPGGKFKKKVGLLNLLLNDSLRFRKLSSVLRECTSRECPNILLFSAEYTVALADVHFFQCYYTTVLLVLSQLRYPLPMSSRKKAPTRFPYFSVG